MKKFLTTIFNGYLSLLFPLIVTIILLEKLHHLIRPVVDRIGEHLHITRILGVLGVILISVMIMILLGYLAGLLVKSTFVKNKITKFETAVLDKIPAYNLFKSIFGTEVGIKGSDNFLPALLSDGDSQGFSFCYVTNESPDFYTVYVCEGGLSGGELRIVPKKAVKLLDITLTEFTRLVKQYGVGSSHITKLIV